jgi:RHS repeat-associated protein
VTEYEWDYRHRLVKVTEKNAQGTVTQVVEYVYDVFDRRIGRKLDTTAPFDMANAVIERYVLDDIHNGLVSADGGNVVLDFVDPDGSGAQPMVLAKRYLYGEAVDQLFAQEDLSKTLGDVARNLWPLVDHLGTVRDLAKQDGTIAAHYKYDSFGRVTSGDTSKTGYLFTSREFDPATGLQYNRARWYDPRVGRWLSEDPLRFEAGDGNLGRYVGNHVINRLDSSGQVQDDNQHDERLYPDDIRRRIDRIIDEVERWIPFPAPYSRPYREDIYKAVVDIQLPPLPWDGNDPAAPPPDPSKHVRKVLPRVVISWGKQLPIDEIWDDVRDWALDNPSTAIGVGAAAGIGVGLVLPAITKELSPLLERHQIPARFDSPWIRVPVRAVPGLTLGGKGTWIGQPQPREGDMRFELELKYKRDY